MGLGVGGLALVWRRGRPLGSVWMLFSQVNVGLLK